MPKLKLLILDANVVIYLHEHELWQAVLERCEVHLSGIVIDDEVRFYPGTEYDEVIDLSPDVDAGRIQRFDVPVSEVKVFRDQFDPVYRGDLDPGEEESLAHMLHAAKDFLISSGDAIVYRILGNVNRGDAGISLEEVLQKVGLSRGNLPWQYTKAFQERYTRVGQQEAIQGLGRKQSGRWSTLAWQFSRPLRPGSSPPHESGRPNSGDGRHDARVGPGRSGRPSPPLAPTPSSQTDDEGDITAAATCKPEFFL
ncbi:MAG: hypothetical protein ABFD16_07625 [Thermoguttaceae bacterium]